MYSKQNKEQLNQQFSTLWDRVKGSVPPQERIQMWSQHMRDCWEKELPEVKSTTIKEVDIENEKLMAEWKTRATFTGSPEDFET
jgi:hypothetical protein